LRTTIVGVVAMVASLALLGCGGGGGGGDAGSGGNAGSSGNGGSTGSTGSTGGALSGPSSSPLPCAPNLCVNFSYSAVTVARLLTGGFGPNSTQAVAGLTAHYSITGGALPQGMTLDAATGLVHGTPTVNGLYDATVQLTVDGYSGSLSTHLGMQVLEPKLQYEQPWTPVGPQVGLTPVRAQFLVVGMPASGTTLALALQSSGGETMDANPNAVHPASYSVIGAQSLPPGLSLDAATGAITGTPTQPGVWLVQVQAVCGGSTFTGWAPISVGPVIDASIGQPAAAPVQIPVHATAGTQYTSEWVEGFGSEFAQFTYDATTNVMTITPTVVPAGVTPGFSQSSVEYFIQLPDGSMATAGYVEDVH
jgi:hypothetical protein